jgi:hypothetical protein
MIVANHRGPCLDVPTCSGIPDYGKRKMKAGYSRMELDLWLIKLCGIIEWRKVPY